MFPERIETDRLELTALTAENVDVLDFYEICSGNSGDDVERITEFLPWEPHDTPKETKAFLEGLASQREAGENAEFAVFPTDAEIETDEQSESVTDQLAGAVGLCPHWDRRTGELGIWLRKPFWGRGYYDEALAVLTRMAFERLDLDAVEIVHQHGNDNSRRATEKFVESMGGRHEGHLRNYWTGPGGPNDAHRYTVTREEWVESAED
jgi:RimJ/RimL family protein N-acetyltransferase